jgi:hypothetical protein
VKLTIKVTTVSAGKTYEELVETSLATIIKWERHYKKRAGDLAAGFCGRRPCLYGVGYFAGSRP